MKVFYTWIMSLLFFDGYCGLCNRFVDLLLKIDRQGKIQFSPLQGETAELYLPKKLRENLDSVVLYDNNLTYRKSQAIFRAFYRIGGVWKIVSWLRILPQPLTDLVYDWVADRRYRWFGKLDTCRLPTPEERQRFLP